MPLLVPAAAAALAAILFYRWLCLLTARRRVKRGASVGFIVRAATAMEEGQALLSPKASQAATPPASPVAPPANAVALAAAHPVPAPAKVPTPRAQKQLVAKARAQAMIESFGLPFEPLAELLRNLGCIIAGGSMVHAYMGQPPAEFAGDLDILCKPEHVKPLRALLKAAGYRPAPLATIGVVSVDIPLTINGQHISPEPAGSGMASAAGNTAADCGYPSFVLSGDTDVEVPAAVSNIASDGSYGAAAPGYTALISSLGAAAAAAGGPAPATDAATGQPAALDPYPPLGHLLGVRDFVHLASGRKVQLIACREPRDAPSHFDLSAAATLFDGSQLRTLYPATTDKWEMFWLRSGDPRGPCRLAKYQSKGFKLVPSPA